VCSVSAEVEERTVRVWRGATVSLLPIRSSRAAPETPWRMWGKLSRGARVCVSVCCLSFVPGGSPSIAKRKALTCPFLRHSFSKVVVVSSVSAYVGESLALRKAHTQASLTANSAHASVVLACRCGAPSNRSLSSRLFERRELYIEFSNTQKTCCIHNVHTYRVFSLEYTCMHACMHTIGQGAQDSGAGARTLVGTCL
jgi:hypothetical protein